MGYNKLQVLEMTEENGLAWTMKADLPVHRHDPASIVHEGKIMLIGGCAIEEHASSVMVYDEHTDSWATAPPLPVACQGRDDYKALYKRGKSACSFFIGSDAWRAAPTASGRM